jgi:Chaperone of endosialidase
VAITSYPFDSQETSEAQFSQWAREFQDSGIAASSDSSSWQVSADGSGMTVSVQPGFAIVRGFAVMSTAIESVSIAAAAASARVDRIVLRLDPAANSIVLAVVAGTPGSGEPPLTQTDTGIYELPLGKVAVGANVTSIASTAVTEDRRFTGSRVGSWTTATRPASPRIGRLGYNASTSNLEFWDGSAWKGVSPVVTWANVDSKPTAFPPIAHTHPWADVSDKPATFPPSAHSHDDRYYTEAEVDSALSGKSPTSHGHGDLYYSQYYTDTHFADRSHTHNYNDVTVSWANGSERVRTNGPSGSGYYAVWVDGYDKFCKNTSSIRYKENVRDAELDGDVLALRPVIYDRKATEVDGEMVEGAKDEFGLIAEEVAEVLPEAIVYDREGRIDSVRYDLLAVALVPVLREQRDHIAALEARLSALEARA